MVETIDSTTYEYYLQAKHKLARRKSMDDIEVVRGLLEKAMQLDNNFMEVKYLLGETYQQTGEIKKAGKIFNDNLKQAESSDNQLGIALSLTGLGDIFSFKGEYKSAIEKYNKALIIFDSIGNKNAAASQYICLGVAFHYMLKLDKAKENYNKAIKIKRELNDEIGIMYASNAIGYMYTDTGDFKKGLDWHNKTLKISQNVENQAGIGWSYNGLAVVKGFMGFYIEAIGYLEKTLKIRESISDKFGEVHALIGLGWNYIQLKDYQKSIKYLERSISIIEEHGIDKMLLLSSSTFLFLSYKKTEKDFDKGLILKLIDEVPNYEYPGYFALYQLLEDKLYLKEAYFQIQKLADYLEPEVAAKFLNYPIPKAIVEEWEKVK